MRAERVCCAKMRRTTRAALGMVGLRLISACGGQAQTATEELPVDGFYQVTTFTRNDTCSPATPQATSQELVQGTSAVVNLNLWSGLRQDVPWTGSEPIEIWHCAANDAEVRTEPILRVDYEISALTAHSFKTVSQFDWHDPTACPPRESVVLPSAPCSVERTQTFELIAACPTELNNAGCPAPSR